MLAISMRSYAQIDDMDDNIETGRRGYEAEDDLNGVDGYLDYQPIRFGIDDVLTVVLLLVACYVFGKIWKGCSYLLLIFAALAYYMTH